MKRTEKTPMQVALFPQVAGKFHGWVAQCLDYDLVAQGATPDHAQASFIRLVHSHVALCVANNEKPFDSIITSRSEAPQKKSESARLSTERALAGLRFSFNRMDKAAATVPAV